MTPAERLTLNEVMTKVHKEMEPRLGKQTIEQVCKQTFFDLAKIRRGPPSHRCSGGGVPLHSHRRRSRAMPVKFLVHLEEGLIAFFMGRPP